MTDDMTENTFKSKTKEYRKAQNRAYYVKHRKDKKAYCEVCEKYITLTYEKRHKKGLTHLLKEKCMIIDSD